MRVDDLERALRELAADQPGVSPTAREDVIRRARRRRLQSGGAILVVLASLVAVPLVVLRGSPSRTRLATVPRSAPEVTVPASTPTTAHTRSTTGGDLVPPGFSPVSVTFVSARTGWVLGTAGCTSQPCA